MATDLAAGDRPEAGWRNWETGNHMNLLKMSTAGVESNLALKETRDMATCQNTPLA